MEGGAGNTTSLSGSMSDAIVLLISLGLSIGVFSELMGKLPVDALLCVFRSSTPLMLSLLLDIVSLSSTDETSDTQMPFNLCVALLHPLSITTPIVDIIANLIASDFFIVINPFRKA